MNDFDFNNKHEWQYIHKIIYSFKPFNIWHKSIRIFEGDLMESFLCMLESQDHAKLMHLNYVLRVAVDLEGKHNKTTEQTHLIKFSNRLQIPMEMEEDPLRIEGGGFIEGL